MTDPSCRRCKWTLRGQSFVTATHVYSIGGALDLLKIAPRAAVILPAEQVFAGLQTYGIRMKHVEHVSVRYPVIAVQQAEGFLIIDGTHRAWKRLFRRLPIRAYLLTEAEAVTIREAR